jgi:hypothetical protein
VELRLGWAPARGHSSGPGRIPLRHTNTPELGWIKCDLDGAFYSHENAGATGVILRDHNGSSMQGKMILGGGASLEQLQYTEICNHNGKLPLCRPLETLSCAFFGRTAKRSFAVRLYMAHGQKTLGKN